jgi:hypothetical protein
MKMSMTTVLLAACGIFLAASPHSQSLADVARKERARRTENAKTGKSAQVVAMDEQAIRQIDAPTFMAVQISGRPESSSTREPQLGELAPSGATPPVVDRSKPIETVRTPPQASTPAPGKNKNKLERGWSDVPDHTNGRGNRVEHQGSLVIYR